MTASSPRSTRHVEGRVLDRVTAAIGTADGLALALPLRAQAPRWIGADALAVTLEKDEVEIRLTAHRLPLQPLLDQAAAAVRAALSGTDWERAPLRLVVTELAAQAFTRP